MTYWKGSKNALIAATIIAAAATGIEILIDNSIAGDAVAVTGSWVIRDIIETPLTSAATLMLRNGTGTYSWDPVVAMVESSYGTSLGGSVCFGGEVVTSRILVCVFEAAGKPRAKVFGEIYSNLGYAPQIIVI